jgi:VWFA-related protein
VADLKPKDLIVVEDGAPRTVTGLRHEPANIVLVLDLSNEIGTFKNGPSRRDDLEEPPPKIFDRRTLESRMRPATRELADNFVAALGEADHVAIIQYAEKAQVLQDWTGDRTEALHSLRSKLRAGLKASYYDALLLAAEKLRERPTGRRIIVLVSDGIDSASRARREPALKAVAQASATVFVVAWADLLARQIEGAIEWMKGNEPSNSATAKRVRELRQHVVQLGGAALGLRELAEASGGEMLRPASFEEFVATPRGIITEVGAQYTLAYLTEQRPSADPLRTVEVLPTRAGLTVRARRSYYAHDETRQ